MIEIWSVGGNISSVRVVNRRHSDDKRKKWIRFMIPNVSLGNDKLDRPQTERGGERIL